MLEIENLKTNFNTYDGVVKALNGVNLKIEDGEIFDSGFLKFGDDDRNHRQRLMFLLFFNALSNLESRTGIKS